MTENKKTMQSVIWFRVRPPFGSSSGSTVAAISLAEAMSTDWSLHLVTLRSRDRSEEPTLEIEPFSSVTSVTPSHLRSLPERCLLPVWYLVLHLLCIRSISDSVQSCRALERALKKRAHETGASLVIVEYLYGLRAASKVHGTRSVVRIYDVDWVNLKDEAKRAPVWKKWYLNAASLTVLRLAKKRLPRADLVLFISDEDTRDFIDLGVNGPVVPLTLPTARFTKTSHSTSGHKLVFVGSLDWWPNIEGMTWFLNEVFPLVRNQISDCEIDVIGKGHGLDDRMREPGLNLCGFVEDLHEFLSRADVGISPIHHGTGVKVKVLDMLAVGLPIVSTRNGARGTSALHGGARIADGAEEFAREIIELLLSSDKRKELSRQGKSAARFHSKALVSEQIHNVLTDLEFDNGPSTRGPT